VLLGQVQGERAERALELADAVVDAHPAWWLLVGCWSAWRSSRRAVSSSSWA